MKSITFSEVLPSKPGYYLIKTIDNNFPIICNIWKNIDELYVHTENGSTPISAFKNMKYSWSEEIKFQE